LSEADYDEVLDFERSERFTERQKAALAYTSMLVWTPDAVDDALWARLREHFSEEEIVELGAFVCTTFGQQRVIKTWAVGHNEFLAGTTGGLKT
jgi:alkylhydroperoxidase family enzyme